MVYYMYSHIGKTLYFVEINVCYKIIIILVLLSRCLLLLLLSLLRTHLVQINTHMRRTKYFFLNKKIIQLSTQAVRTCFTCATTIFNTQ